MKPPHSLLTAAEQKSFRTFGAYENRYLVNNASSGIEAVKPAAGCCKVLREVGSGDQFTENIILYQVNALFKDVEIEFEKKKKRSERGF